MDRAPRRRFLFTTWEGGGHVQPIIDVAAGLISRGHDCLVVSDACNKLEADAAGVPFRPWRAAPSRTDRSPEADPLRDWEAESPLAIIQGLCDGVIARPARGYAVDVAEILRDFDADVIVSQELLFGVMLAAEAAGKLLALFAANIWSLPTLEGAPPFGAGLSPPSTDEERAMYAMVAAHTRAAFQYGLADLNAARADSGLPPLNDLFDQLNAASRILLGASHAFDYALDPVPEPFTYVGPYLSDPVWTEPFELPSTFDSARRLVLVSFSSMYQGQEPVLRQVIAALAELPVNAVVTLGPVLDPADFPASSNVAVVRSAPHSQLLGRACLFITHCGHGSTLRPLMAGVPLLCIPLGRDQPDNAARVVTAGAGLRLSKDATAQDIRSSVESLLAEPAYAIAAKALGAQIRQDAAARNAEDILEALANS